MTEQSNDSGRHRPFPDERDNSWPALDFAGGRHVLGGAGDDLVRILTKLTSDVERFESMVLRHRRMLEQLADHSVDLDHDQINRQSERISLAAANLVASARQALDQLSLLAEPAKPLPPRALHRGRPRGMPKDQHTD